VNSELIALVLGPVITAVIGGIGVVVHHWWQGHDRIHRAKRDLSQARDEVAFIEAWIAAEGRLGSETTRTGLRERALADLEAAYSLANQSTAIARSHPEPLSLKRLVLELLLIPLGTVIGKIARLAYWLSLLWTLIWAGVGVDTTLQGTNGSGTDIALALFMIVAVGVIPAWIVRVFVVWIDRWYAGRRDLAKKRQAIAPDAGGGQPPSDGPTASRPAGVVQPPLNAGPSIQGASTGVGHPHDPKRAAEPVDIRGQRAPHA
jgi:hypothetical protein